LQHPLVDLRALQRQHGAHLCEHVARYRRLNIHAQAGTKTSIQKSLNWGRAMPHLHFDGGSNGHRAARIYDHLNLVVTQAGAVDIGGVRTQQPGSAHFRQFALLPVETDPDVNADANADLAGQFPVVPGDIQRRELRAARGARECEQLGYSTPNTSAIERRNGSARRMNAHQVRRSLAFSRRDDTKLTLGWWGVTVYNWSRPHRSLRQALVQSQGKKV
jgi:hypothetical protein